MINYKLCPGISGREDLIGFSSPGIPSVDSAVESWDSSQSPTNIQQSPHLYKSGKLENCIKKNK